MKNFFAVIFFAFILFLPGLVRADMGFVNYASLKCEDGDSWITDNIDECKKLGASEFYSSSGRYRNDIYIVYNEEIHEAKEKAGLSIEIDSAPGNPIGCCKNNKVYCDGENDKPISIPHREKCGEWSHNSNKTYTSKTGHCCEKVFSMDGITDFENYSMENLKYYLEFIGIGITALVLFSVFVLSKIRSKSKPSQTKEIKK